MTERLSPGPQPAGTRNPRDTEVPLAHAPPLSRPDELAERISLEMSADWGRGDRRPAEDYLARHPEVGKLPTAAARVIYEEICLREWVGVDPGSEEVFARFPQWRAELKMLLDCHRLVHPRQALPELPKVGERFGEYRLKAVLGRGTRGCVFLATQETLADRPVVLKVTARRGGEHLSLARLQHPHVVPLYAFHEFPERDLRALCLPYLGGTTLDRALARLALRNPAELSGAVLMQVVDEARTELIDSPGWSGPRQFLAGAIYPSAICWIGACLADALHYAHVRGVVHLDLKPSNILLADDGQPMLLDFHLARGPLVPGGERPEHLGGTPGYMSPEQADAMAAIRHDVTIPSAVDGRSDVFSLGVVLFESLTGMLPPRPDPSNDPDSGQTFARALRSIPRVGPGLAEIIARCLAANPDARYPDAAALAADLRRHLGHLPLQGAHRQGLLRRWLSSWRGPTR